MKKKYSIIATVIILAIGGGISWYTQTKEAPASPNGTPEGSFVKFEIPEGWVLYRNDFFNIQFFYPPEFDYTEYVDSRRPSEIPPKNGKVLAIAFRNYPEGLYEEEWHINKKGDLNFLMEIDGPLSEQYKEDFSQMGRQEGKKWFVDVFAVSDTIVIRKGVGESIEKKEYVGTDFVIAFNRNSRVYIANHGRTDLSSPETQTKEAEIIEQIALTVREID